MNYNTIADASIQGYKGTSPTLPLKHTLCPKVAGRSHATVPLLPAKILPQHAAEDRKKPLVVNVRKIVKDNIFIILYHLYGFPPLPYY